MQNKSGEGNPTIAAIIPLYNKECSVERSIASVFNQTVRPDEIIVVNDGSTDNSGALAKTVVSEWKVGRVIDSKNKGVSSARNLGVDVATSELCCFLDADDEWSDQHIEEISGLAGQHPECGVFSTRHCRITKKGERVEQVVNLPSGHWGEVPNFLEKYRKGYGIIHSSSVCIRRDVIKAIGGFPEGAKKGEDIYTWLVLGDTARFAYSDMTTVFRHEDFLGSEARKGEIPYHFEAFLDKGGLELANNRGAIAKFLKRNLLVGAFNSRISKDNVSFRYFRHAATRLGPMARLLVAFTRAVPRPALIKLRQVYRRKRVR